METIIDSSLSTVQKDRIQIKRQGNYCCEKSLLEGICSDCKKRYCDKCRTWMSFEKYKGSYKLYGDSCSNCRDNKRQSRSLSKKLRFSVLSRDNFTCRYCGRSAPKVELRVDHVIPVSKGGNDSIDNLVTACQDCNAGKSNTILGLNRQPDYSELFPESIKN